jgi:hypothetical protein
MDGELDDRIRHDVMRARLVLGFVSARARACSNGACGRQRRCLARYRPGTWLCDRLGACPNMSEAEWAVVRLGIRGNGRRLKPWLEARAAEQEAKAPSDIWKLSAEERWRRWHLPEAVAARAEEERQRLAQPGPLYAQLLWQEVHDDTVVMPQDLRAAEARLLRRMAERGCRCAAERRSDGCGEGPDCPSARSSGPVVSSGF